MQISVLEKGERVEEPPSTSGRPFEPPPRIAERKLAGSWSESKLGLLPGFGADAVLWALLSETHEALIALAAAVVSHPPECCLQWCSWQSF